MRHIDGSVGFEPQIANEYKRKFFQLSRQCGKTMIQKMGMDMAKQGTEKSSYTELFFKAGEWQILPNKFFNSALERTLYYTVWNLIEEHTLGHRLLEKQCIDEMVVTDLEALEGCQIYVQV